MRLRSFAWVAACVIASRHVNGAEVSPSVVRTMRVEVSAFGRTPKVIRKVPKLTSPQARTRNDSQSNFRGIQLASNTTSELPICDGFPGRSNSKTFNHTEGRVLLSLNMFEPSWYVRATIENAFKFLEPSTLIVLHLNKDSGYAVGDQDFEYIWQHPRVELNCNRVSIQVGSFYVSVMDAMLYNVEWARKRNITGDFVVFQASNMWWAKPGMETHVRRTKSSVPRVSDECPNDLIAGHGHAYQFCESMEMHEMKGFENNYGVETFQSCVLRQIQAVVKVKYLVKRKHEGSYYPLAALHRAIDDLKNGSHFSATPCGAAGGQNAYEQSLSSLKLGITEEFVLPTWFANDHTNEGTGDVMCRHFQELYDTPDKKQSDVPFTNCENVMGLLGDGLYAAKFHDLRDRDAGSLKRKLLSECNGNATAATPTTGSEVAKDTDRLVRGTAAGTSVNATRHSS